MTTEDVREQAEGLAASEEELVLIAMFGSDAEELLKVIRGRHSRDSVLIAEDADAERGERIRELVKIVQESGVGEIEIEDEGMRVSVRRADEAPVVSVPVGASVEPVESELEAAACDPASPDGTTRVESPMVGVFYRAPNPGAPAFVDVGDTVVPGQVLCILEAMKLFNELKSETAGRDRGDPRRERAGGRVRRAPVRARARRPGSRRLGAGVFDRVLVANRGEIAVRVIRALHELGVEAVAVYSTADRDALHVELADAAVCIGPPAAMESYLRISNVVAAAETTGCDAVHPGYGFLAENDEFVRACEDNDIVFIGPTADVVEQMGDKVRAKEAMRAAGVPLVPGSDGDGRGRRPPGRSGDRRLPGAAQGRGGRGRQGHARGRDGGASSRPRSPRRARRHRRRSATARCTSRSSWRPRGTSRSRCCATRTEASSRSASASARSSGVTRSSSRSRRRQRSTRRRASRWRRRSRAPARRSDTSTPGTFEFLVGPDGAFYFIEVNCRLQVEHPVSELVTGIDIVREQIRIAAGEPLVATGRAPRRGHAIEIRINAEDPARGFLPRAGHDHAARPAARARRARRHRGARRLHDPAVLRLDDREARSSGTRRATPRSPGPSARCASS